MQLAGALDLVEVALDAGQALLDHAAVTFELRLARSAQKSEAAALPLEMGPGTDQPALLVAQVRVLDLQRPFPRLRPPAEDFQDQPGAIEHLGDPGLLEIALLHRRERGVQDHEPGRMGLYQPGDFFDLAFADECRRRDRGERHETRLDHFEIDCARKSDGFVEPRIRRPHRPRARALPPRRRMAQIRADHDRAPDGRAR